MITKKLSFILMTAFFLSLAIISAVDFSLSPSSVILTPSTSSVAVTISGNTSQVNVLSNTAIVDDDGTTITPSVSQNGQVITVSSAGSLDYDDLTLGKSYAGSILLGNSTANTTISVNYVKSFCDLGAVNNSDLEFSVNIDNDGEGDEEEWLPLDNLQIEVDFENNADWDMDDIIIELGLFDENGKNIAGDLFWISKDDEEADVNDVDEGDNVEHIFEFQVPNDVDEGTYSLMIKAYSDGDEDAYCIDYDSSNVYTTLVELNRESDDERQIILEDIDIEPLQTQCGSDIYVSAKAYNLGSTDQDAVKVILYSKDLNLTMYEVIENFDWDESKTIDFTFTAPRNIQEGTYTLTLYSLYDYDEDDDEDYDDEINFDDDSFGEEAESYKYKLSLDGNCVGSTEANLSLDVQLSEDTPKAVIGRDVVIEAEIENTGNEAETFKVSVSGVSDWAKATIEDSTFELEAGESKTVEIVLDIDKDAEAEEKEFTLKVVYGSETKEQKVLLDLEEGFALSAIGDHLKDNWFIYVIIVDVILIVAIIIAVARMARKRSSA